MPVSVAACVHVSEPMTCLQTTTRVSELPVITYSALPSSSQGIQLTAGHI